MMLFKAMIPLLSIYTNSLLEVCIKECRRKFTCVIDLAMNPHPETRTGDNAMTTLE
jgi:hypothetical protein